MLTVYLKDGARLKVDATLDAFEQALEEAALIRVKTADGRIIGVSPSNVSMVETEDSLETTANGDGAVRPLARAPAH